MSCGVKVYNHQLLLCFSPPVQIQKKKKKKFFQHSSAPCLCTGVPAAGHEKRSRWDFWKANTTLLTAGGGSGHVWSAVILAKEHGKMRFPGPLLLILLLLQDKVDY